MSTVTSKDAMRDLLAAKVAEKLEQDPSVLTRYAAKPLPDSKPYSKKPTVSEKAFQKELEKMREDLSAPDRSDAEPSPTSTGNKLALDDYPGL